MYGPDSSLDNVFNSRRWFCRRGSQGLTASWWSFLVTLVFVEQGQRVRTLSAFLCSDKLMMERHCLGVQG